MFSRTQSQRFTKVLNLRALVTTGLVVALAGCGSKAPSSADFAEPKHIKEPIGVWYTVVAGDTVEGIAQRYSVVFDDIVELNGIADPNELKVGQPLFLYGIDELVKRVSKRRSDKQKGRPLKARFKTKVGPLVWPVRGAVLTSGFGPRGRRKHKGIDLAHKPGTPIYAAASGVVVYSNNKQRGYGNLVIIKHRSGVLTVYAHNRRNLVDEGMRVRQGARIAELGNTGRSTGPHLHFELRVNGRAVNPMPYLPSKK